MAMFETHSRVERYRFASFDKSDEAPAVAHAEVALPPIAPLPLQEAAPAQQPPLSPPPPSFSEQDISAAKQAGYQEGFRAGSQEAESKRNREAEAADAALRAQLEVIANRITLASEAHAGVLKDQKELTLKLALGIARKVAGDALKREPYASIEALLKECAGLIGGQERLVIAVPESKCEGLRQSVGSLRPLLGEFEGEVIIEGDDSLGENDCRVEWKNGSGSRTSETLWAQIESLLRKTVLTT